MVQERTLGKNCGVGKNANRDLKHGCFFFLIRLSKFCFLRMISKEFSSSRSTFINFIALQFLTKECEDRLGCTASGEQSIVNHAFFREMDWGKLEARQIEPPFKPIIVRETM